MPRIADHLLAIMCYGLAALYALGALFALFLSDAFAFEIMCWGTVGMAVLGAAIGLIVGGGQNVRGRSALMQLCLAYVVSPALLAPPFFFLGPQVDPVAAYFDASAALTTTAGSAVRHPEMMAPILFVWRALIAGAGGFMFVVSALAIMSPLSIGGFEMTRSAVPFDNSKAEQSTSMLQRPARSHAGRVLMVSAQLAPYFFVFIGVMLVLFWAFGVQPVEAFSLSLAISATTGYVPSADWLSGLSSIWIEPVIALAMIPPAIGIATHFSAIRSGWRSYLEDPELRYLGLSVGSCVTLMFLWHWIGAVEVNDAGNLLSAGKAVWGSVFMSVSYATTTGLPSAHWDAASEWSGLGSPALLLIGLALLGGGVASTAGGVKLLRAALLAKHSFAELSRLSYPSSLQPIGTGSQHLGLGALRIVFVFVMLYILTIAVVALCLSAVGVELIEALAASIAAVSNTGPVFPQITENPWAFADLPDMGKLVLCLAMMLGRLETLAVVAVLSPAAWRR